MIDLVKKVFVERKVPEFLGEIYDQSKIFRKILRSLTGDFRPKVTAITESKDVDSILVDELVVGMLQWRRLKMPCGL